MTTNPCYNSRPSRYSLRQVVVEVVVEMVESILRLVNCTCPYNHMSCSSRSNYCGVLQCGEPAVW